MSNIVTLKLLSGEEIIGTIEDGETAYREYVKDSITLTKVRSVQMVQTGPGQMGVGIVPWSPSCVDDKIVLSISTICAIVSHNKEIEDAYLAQTSGIQIAGAGSIAT